MRYRVNYGNGQVEYVPGHSKRACYALIADMARQNQPYVGFAFVEFEDPDTGDWFSCGNNHQRR